jgi:hypothetical protein
MTENFYRQLKKINAEKRQKLIQTSPEPKGFIGVLCPDNLRQYSDVEKFRYGTFSWTRVSMSTIILATEELGWEKYINLLGKYQLPACKDRIQKLTEKYDIPHGVFPGYMMTALFWGSGCLFDTGYGGQPFFSMTESSWTMDKCPQIEALKEMGMVDKAENLHVWCDAYDNMFCGHVSDTCWYSHVKCLGEKNRNQCCSYLRETGKPITGKSFYDKIMSMKGEARKVIDTKYTEAFKVGNYMWKNIEKHPMDPLDVAKDGAYTKSRIAAESIIIAANEMGWEKFINLSQEKLSWGFTQAAKNLKSWANIHLGDMEEAGMILGVAYYIMGFEDHSIIEYNHDRIEAVAPRCKLIETAKNMGLENTVEDMCLWCDFYHNHAVKAVNPNLTVTHTHCLGKGDAYCRILID